MKRELLTAVGVLCMTAGMASASDSIQAYAHPTLFGSQGHALVPAENDVIVGGKIYKPCHVKTIEGKQNVVVGRFAGDDSLAAVGATSSLINLLTNLFIGLSIGANVLVARYFGAKKEDELSETVHTAMTVSIVSGLILTVVGVIGAPIILGWMQTPPEVLSLAVIYLRVYFLGVFQKCICQ